MTEAIKSRVLSSLYRVVVCCAFSFSTLFDPPAVALTPLRSPEQRARDKALEAQASQIIKSEVRRCFLELPGSPRKPFNVRFFLSDNGQRVTQLMILDASTGARPPRSARERSALKAVQVCAPYTIPAELRTWGGLWVTIAF
jgi:hypothetical protein